ncbi:MAG: hypothetical protein WCA39_01325 [Nitrososphaeraceae archaeon]
MIEGYSRATTITPRMSRLSNFDCIVPFKKRIFSMCMLTSGRTSTHLFYSFPPGVEHIWISDRIFTGVVGPHTSIIYTPHLPFIHLEELKAMYDLAYVDYYGLTKHSGYNYRRENGPEKPEI